MPSCPPSSVQLTHITFFMSAMVSLVPCEIGTLPSTESLLLCKLPNLVELSHSSDFIIGNLSTLKCNLWCDESSINICVLKTFHRHLADSQLDYMWTYQQQFNLLTGQIVAKLTSPQADQMASWYIGELICNPYNEQQQSITGSIVDNNDKGLASLRVFCVVWNWRSCSSCSRNNWLNSSAKAKPSWRSALMRCSCCSTSRPTRQCCCCIYTTTFNTQRQHFVA